jgi:hypothetical protein
VWLNSVVNATINQQNRQGWWRVKQRRDLNDGAPVGPPIGQSAAQEVHASALIGGPY